MCIVVPLISLTMHWYLVPCICRYALYLTLLKKKVGDTDRLEVPMFFGELCIFDFQSPMATRCISLMYISTCVHQLELINKT